MRFMGQIRHRAHALGISLLLALLGVLPAHAGAELEARIYFDIEAQPLSTAILRYSEQSGVQVTSPSELLSGRHTRGVHGNQSAQAALIQLLEATGLVFEIIDSRTVAIRPAPQTLRGSGGTVPGKAQPGAPSTHGGEPAEARGQATTSGERAVSPAGVSPRVSSSPQEVIVSARKQSETLLDVPQSITAYSAHTIAEYDIRSFIDYATITPNLSFSYGTGQLGFVTSRSVAIRGIGGAGTTALYIDDIPVPESVDPRVVDIERIEILRGPQGTLYGQSSLGGNVRLVTVQPSFTDADAQFATQAGWTSGGANPDYSSDLAGTITVVPDRVAVRAVMFVDHEGGFLTRTFFINNGAGEGSDDNQGAFLTYGGSLSILNRVTDRLDVTLRILYQDQSDHGWPATWAQLPQFIPASYIVNRVADVQEVATDNWHLPSLQISYKGSGWSLSSSTNYFSRKAHDIEDGTEGTDDVLSIYGLKLDPYSPIPWDGYYMDHRLVHETRVSIAKVRGISAVAGVYLSKVLDNGILNSHDIPGIAAAGLWPTNLGWYSQNENEIRSAALFGELYYDLSNFELTLGLRGYALRENGLVFAEGALNGQVTDQTLEQTSQQGVSPKFDLSYKFTSDTMAYGLASSGFRPGGAGRVLPPICEPFPPRSNLQANQATSYGSDSVWNYELGAKSELLDQRLLLTGSVFEMNWTDIQQTITLPQCFITFIANAGAARARGGELELSGRLWQGLELRAGVGFDNAIITNEGLSEQPVGSRVYQIPRWTWMTAGTYTQPLDPQLLSFLTVELAHVGDSVSGTSGIGTGLTRPAYTVLNSRFGVQWANNELALYANNSANERANLGDLNPISYAPVNADGIRMLRIAVLQPFQMGVQFRHRF
jgi:iron complex outermembrane recepter protein